MSQEQRKSPENQPNYTYERISDGSLWRAREVDVHHVQWPRRDYKRTKVEQRYRNMTGMLLNLCITDHRNLHYKLKIPPKPENALMVMAIDYNEALVYGTDYEVFDDMISFFQGVSEQDSRQTRAEQARRLVRHYTAQRPFIQSGMVRRISNYPLKAASTMAERQGRVADVQDQVLSLKA